MTHGFQTPPVRNEPILQYAPNSPERKQLQAKIAELHGRQVEIPVVIGGRSRTTGKTGQCVEPHDHKHQLGTFHFAGKDEIQQAIDASQAAWKEWSETPFATRAAIFLKAADLLAGPWRSTLNASTMLGQSKTAFQAEIDAACELADFWRFNVAYAEQLYKEQPDSPNGMWNRVEYRPLEGFTLAITPFNFTSIAGNLPTAPVLMGGVALWKPASSAVYSAHYIMQLLQEAGLPDGVINFIPSSGRDVGEVAFQSPHLAGLHFTGSTEVFRTLWKTIGNNIASYRSYPRIVGETGGKDFIFADVSADRDALVTAIVRGAFEYQGQKCSAASRMFIPESVWKDIKDPLVAQTRGLAMGDPKDFSNFLAAVIDRGSFDKISGYIAGARESADAEILTGGECDDSQGFFIQPTLIQAKQPNYTTMCDEIFGPVATIFVYPDAQQEEALNHCDQGSIYGLTGAVFGQDRKRVMKISDRLRHAAGNFYINDKPTGAVVGQQPFGGSRGSGTNDKAGSVLNLIRWCSPRTIKETFVPPTDYRYPHMDS